MKITKKRKNYCHNRGVNGHEANTYKSEPFCPLCSEKGNRHDKGFKQYIRAMNQARTEKYKNE